MPITVDAVLTAVRNGAGVDDEEVQRLIANGASISSACLFVADYRGDHEMIWWMEKVAERARVAAAERAADAERARMLPRNVAFAMGHHERLGAASLVRGLEPEVLRMVLDRV
mmetsp:Transcript_64560/g.154012  ORF Transcript_64560/g.154012 Transcript_64560/m.154012 type:complete len:113 (+) Transcript_64560:12-350(+)